MGVSSDAANTQNSRRPTRALRAMPTLVATAVASLALVIAVGLQSPAISVGLRWTPAPRFRPRDIDIKPLDGFGPDPLLHLSVGWPTWTTSVLATLVALALLAVLVRWLFRLTRLPPRMNIARLGADSGVLSEANAQILQSGLAAAIEILSADGADRDLGNAVVQAWQGLEDAAAAAGLHRRPAETASEFTARILYRSRRSAEPIAALLSLYQRVRFGEHYPTADEIATARHSLDVLVGHWQADFPKRHPTAGSR